MLKTINLLPKVKQQELRFVVMLRGVLVISAIGFLSLILVFLAQFATKYYLEIEAAGVKKRIADLQVQVKKTESSKIKAQVKAQNDLVLDFKNLAATSPKWSKIIKKFAPLPPEGVRITSFNVEPARKMITINGQSPTRELVKELHDRILADKENFTGIDFPLDNIANPTNNTFHFSFFMTDELLK